jgi:hypothetical protein
MKKLFLGLFLVLGLQLQTANAVPADNSLDTLFKQAGQDRAHSPFERGEAKVKRHPLYKELVELARAYNTKIVWASNVAVEVLKFPYNDERVKIDNTWDLEGWFDEFLSPNEIVLDKNTFLSTILHETRHAIQLGSHGRIAGNWFDKLLQSNKRKVTQFQERLKKMKMGLKERKALHMQATRLVEMCSEINAHSDEMNLGKALGDKEQVTNNKDFVNEYKAEYTKAYKALKASEISKNEAFIENVDEGLDKFLKQK